MRTLSDILLAEHQREAFTAACVNTVEHHLNGMRSLRGMALKAGLAMFKKAVPDAIPRAVTKLLPEITLALEPLHQRFRQSGDRDFSVFLRKNTGEAVDAVISVTDRRVAASPNEMLRSAYPKFRDPTRSEIEALWPELAKTISAYLD